VLPDSQCALKEASRLSTVQLARRRRLDCSNPLPLFNPTRGNKSGRALPQSKTLSRGRVAGMEHSCFVILSSFVIRHSSFASVLRHSTFVIALSFVIRHSAFPGARVSVDE